MSLLFPDTSYTFTIFFLRLFSNYLKVGELLYKLQMITKPNDTKIYVFVLTIFY